MNQPWIRLRRGMLALAVAGSLGFGATQAFAVPAQARLGVCPPYSGPTFNTECDMSCQSQGYDYGFCRYGQCVCRTLTPP